MKYLVQALLTHHLLASVFAPLFTSVREITLAEILKTLPPNRPPPSIRILTDNLNNLNIGFKTLQDPFNEPG